MFGMSETVAENIAASAKFDGQNAIFRSFQQRNTECVLIRPEADLKIEKRKMVWKYCILFSLGAVSLDMLERAP
jgi:hypothetical protein